MKGEKFNMIGNYELEQVKNDLYNEIAGTKAKLALWQAVTFPTKKDGTPFKVMSKNISGARYTECPYSMQFGEYELKVSGTINGKYAEDSIFCYECICYMKDEKKLAKTENYMPKQEYLNQVYAYDLDDIKQAVNDRIKRLESWLNELEQQASIADKAFNDFVSEVQQAVNKLSDITGGSTSYLYNTIKSTVRDKFCLL